MTADLSRQEFAADTPPRTLADKLNALFRLIRQSNGRKHTNAEVSRFCAEHTGQSFSREYMTQLRTGKATNPTKHNLEALARFFDVSPAYFF
ncbi:helix-turn-helix transcriptional regulator, partial [Solihabitans fulvus]